MCFGEQLAERSVVYVQVQYLGNIGGGTLGVAELVEDHVVGLITCEGGVDVVGVVTPLVRGGAQVLHGDQVVESVCCSGCMRKEKWKRTVKDKSKKKGRKVKSKRETHMDDCGWDENQEHLEP